MAEIEKESTDKTGLRSDVVTLYQGGQYHLYTYKKYTDVRLVFAPEFAVAFFGGDPDNFEYPRYDLDVCFFRAYENGKPARPEHYLKWSKNGTQGGRPGLRRRPSGPHQPAQYRGQPGVPPRRRRSDPARLSPAQGSLSARVRQDQSGGRAAVEGRALQLSRTAARRGSAAWADCATRRSCHARPRPSMNCARGSTPTPRRKQPTATPGTGSASPRRSPPRSPSAINFLERGFAFDSELFTIARHLVRLAEEKAKPNSERLKEYRDSALQSLELQLFSEAPIYPEFEEAKLAHSLAYWKKQMPDDPLVERVLRGRTPEEAARQFVRGTKLADVSFAQKLAEGGKAAIESCDDPMIKLALAVDADARAIRKRYEDEVEGVAGLQLRPDRQGNVRGEGRLDLSRRDLHPAARLRHRQGIRGRRQDDCPLHHDRRSVPACRGPRQQRSRTSCRRHGSRLESRDALKLETPLNFVSTADIIGGNSGSPVVNRDNEVVGLIFDGNIQSLVLDFGYDDKVARAISVDSRGMIEALRHIYHADRLVKELAEPD